MNKLRKLLLILGLPILALAQTNTFTTTTLSSAIASASPGQAATTVYLGSCTGVNPPSLSSGTIGSALFIDKELLQVTAVPSTSPCVATVQRGFSNGTRVTGHLTGTLVWIGNPEWYSGAPAGSTPSGTCTKTALNVYPDIHVLDGSIYTCDSLGLWGYAGPGLSSPYLRNSVTQVSGTYAALYTDQTIEATANSFTITLPAAAAYPGKAYILSNTSSGTVTVTTAHGCASYTTAGCTVYSNGTLWQTN